MNRKGVLSEPHVPRPDSLETSPLLAVHYDSIASHTENTGGSAVDGAALRRNEQESKNIVHTKPYYIF